MTTDKELREGKKGTHSRIVLLYLNGLKTRSMRNVRNIENLKNAVLRFTKNQRQDKVPCELRID